jgi:hypothetical protein
MSREEHFYHGTVEHLNPGDAILPATKAGVPLNHKISSPEHAYATTDESGAWEYAEMAHAWHVNRSQPPFKIPRVYEVTPLGEHEEDTNAGTYSGDRKSRAGWQVVSETQMPGDMGEPDEWRR